MFGCQKIFAWQFIKRHIQENCYGILMVFSSVPFTHIVRSTMRLNVAKFKKRAKGMEVTETRAKVGESPSSYFVTIIYYLNLGMP